MKLILPPFARSRIIDTPSVNVWFTFPVTNSGARNRVDFVQPGYNGEAHFFCSAVGWQCPRSLIVNCSFDRLYRHTHSVSVP